MKDKEISKLKQAGEVTQKVKEFAKDYIKKDMSLLKIANKIEEKIEELGAKPAFPVNLSINEIAAHATPSPTSEEKAYGLLKVDLGAHIDGFVADTAFSINLEDNPEFDKMIETAKQALNAGVDKINIGVPLKEIGKAIEDTIDPSGFQPVINLSGHSIDEYDLHSGITIPNVDNDVEKELDEGVYAIEPFVTTGHGKVIDGKPSGIYHIEKEGTVRDPFAREVLNYIKKEFQTLPFCLRWIHKKFGSRALIAMKRIEEANLVHHYPQLVEKDRKPVAQAEHTIILTKYEKIVTT